MIVTRFALPVRSPMPFIVPWTCVAPGLDGGERVGDRAAGVVVAVDADARRRRARRRRRPTAAAIWPGSDAAVGVAQHDPLGARVGRGAQAGQRVVAVVRASRRRSARRRRARACRAPARKATDSPIIARFSSRRRAHDLLDVQAARLADDRADRREAVGEHGAGPSSCVGASRRAGASCRTRRSARARASRRASSAKSSASLGFEDGKPASMRWTPSSSRRCTTRSFSSAVSDMPPPPMPSRRVAS